MANDETTDSTPDDTTPPETPEGDDELRLETYDLDHDGKVSALENVRAELGVLDARLEEIADEDHGVKGKLADAAHHVIDKLDND